MPVHELDSNNSIAVKSQGFHKALQSLLECKLSR